MEKTNEVVPVQAPAGGEAVIDTSGFNLDAVRALARRDRLPGRSWPTELRPPVAALMGCR